MSNISEVAAPNSKTWPPAKGFNHMAVVLLGLIGAIQVADPLISSLALVKASAELNMTASEMSLAAGISTLALAGTVLFGGLMADRLGRRWMLFLSVFVAAAGELITAISPDTTIYLLGRVIAGIALGVVWGASYGMLRNVSAANSLGPAMATYSIMNGIVPVVAMVVTGVLVGINWRLAYVFLPVFSILIVWFIPVVLPKVARMVGGKIDWLGLLLAAIGIAGLLYGISNGSGGIEKPAFWLPILIGIAGLVLFGVRQKMSSKAIFPIKLLAHPAFLGAVLMGIFWNFLNASVAQMLPNFWQYVTHIKPSEIGVAELPMSATGIIGSVIAGIALGKGSKPRTTSAIGYCLMVVGLLSYVFITPTATYWIFLPGMVIASVGWMMNATSQGNLFIQLAPAKYFGPVSSSKLMVGQFGYSLGLTGSTVMISMLTLASVSKLTNGAVAGDGNWDAITEYMANPSSTPTNTALAAVKVADIQAAYTSAFVVTAVVVAVIAAIAGIAVYLLLKSKKADVPVTEFLGLPADPAPQDAADAAPAKATAATKTAAKPATKTAAKPAAKKAPAKKN